MFLSGLATAVPERSYTQPECWEALQRADRPELDARTRAILRGILTHDNGIERRSLAVDRLDEAFDSAAQAIGTGRADQAKAEELNSVLMDFAGAGRKITREDVLKLTRSLEEVAGKSPPEPDV